MGKFLVVSDDIRESFTRSKCTCKVCNEMNDIQDFGWNNFIKNKPKMTSLQKKMIGIIKKIENREKIKKNLY